jgi:hypothetical protein
MPVIGDQIKTVSPSQQSRPPVRIPESLKKFIRSRRRRHRLSRGGKMSGKCPHSLAQCPMPTRRPRHRSHASQQQLGPRDLGQEECRGFFIAGQCTPPPTSGKVIAAFVPPPKALDAREIFRALATKSAAGFPYCHGGPESSDLCRRSQCVRASGNTLTCVDMEGAMRWHEADVLRVAVIGGATAAGRSSTGVCKAFLLRHGRFKGTYKR